MSPWSALAIFAAGLAAGTVNVIVGAGSLITFPLLLALGYPPVMANVANNVGLVPGNLSGSIAYRSELVGQRDRVVRLGIASLAGAVTGATLLLALPSTVFRTAVPILILVASLLMAAQPTLTRLLESRGPRPTHGGPFLLVGVFLCALYGGYFGAAQGVILITLLAIFIDDGLQRLNGTKNVLVTLVNLVAAVVFIVFAHVLWSVALLIGVGTTIGGQLGARIGRRLPAPVLRYTVVGVGLVVSVVLAVEWF
jgi:uncharacterized membrane protein YfcA